MNTLSVDQTWQHLKQLYEMEQALSKLDQCTSKMTVEEVMRRVAFDIYNFTHYNTVAFESVPW